MKKKSIISLVTLMLLTVVLVACGGGKTAKKVSEKDVAKEDATTVLNYMYKGKSTGVKAVTGKSASDFTDEITSALYDKKISDFKDQGLALEYKDLDLNADPIMHQWVKVRVKGFQNIKKYKITSVSVKGSKATIKFKIDPLATLSGANNLNAIKNIAFGDTDLSLALSNSEDPEVKSAMNLLNFKLYDMLYGDHAYPFPQYGKDKEVTMTMVKDGDHYTVDKDTINDLMKDSSVDKYSTDKSKTEEEKEVKSTMQDA